MNKPMLNSSLLIAVNIIRESQKTIVKLENELADYKQTSGELCEVCGWRTAFPGIGCVNCLYYDSLKQIPEQDRLIRQHQGAAP
jgi:hypothetical protein